MQDNSVVITGLGIISSLGQGVPVFRDALFTGRSAFSRMSYPLLSFPVITADIKDFSFIQALTAFSDLSSERISQLKRMAAQLPQPVRMAIIAALEAWKQAELDQNPVEDAFRIGCVIAAQNESTHYQYDLYEKFHENPDYLSPSYALNFMDSIHIGVLSELFKIYGEGFTVGGSSASGNIALIKGFQLIQSGLLDACLIVGSVADLSPMELEGFHNAGALGGHSFAAEPQKACRPFDEKHEGFIPGQAAAAIVLESFSSAKKRKAKPLGSILAGAILLDGNRLTNPSCEGEMRVMKKVMADAKIAPEDINYINTHGTSAPLGDDTEIEAIEKIFGGCSKEVHLNSTKSLTGHCLWSAGVVEAVATLIQMQEGFVHPTLNLENPTSKKSRFVTGKSESLAINVALSNSFGFGGINSTIAFKKMGKGATK